jgi:hypothetical protein
MVLCTTQQPQFDVADCYETATPGSNVAEMHLDHCDVIIPSWAMATDLHPIGASDDKQEDDDSGRSLAVGFRLTPLAEAIAHGTAPLEVVVRSRWQVGE